MSRIPHHDELLALTDEELIALYNAAATNTVVGTAFYLEELSRRKAARESSRMLNLTKTMRTLTWVILALTLANVVLVAAPLLQAKICE